MRIAKKLYVGSDINKGRRSVLLKLRAGKWQPGVYVICPSVSEKDLLDLIPAFMLYRYRNPLIVGLAASRQEAMELCGEILLDVYARTGSYDVRSIFSE